MDENEKKFDVWNEEMVKKYNPDVYHNSTNHVIRWIEKLRTRVIIRALRLTKGDTVLDIGCGAGNMLQNIAREVSDIEMLGVDLSDMMVSLAKEKLVGQNVTIVKGNVEHLPESIKSRKFSKIFCSEVIEHVENPIRVLEEIKAISLPDSIVVVSFPHDHLIDQIKDILRKLGLLKFIFPNISQNHMEWHKHDIDIKKFKELVAGHFEIIRVQGIPVPFLPIRYVVTLRPIIS